MWLLNVRVKRESKTKNKFTKLTIQNLFFIGTYVTLTWFCFLHTKGPNKIHLLYTINNDNMEHIFINYNTHRFKTKIYLLHIFTIENHVLLYVS